MSDGLLSDAAVAAIQASQKTEILEIDGYQFTTRPVFDPDAALFDDPDPVAKTLELATLTGLVQLVATFQDKDPLIVHVESPHSVAVLSEMRDLAHDREVYARAKTVAAGFRFENFYDVEGFIIAAQTHFDGDPETARLLLLVGNVKEESVRTSADDGVTQIVTARAGIAKREDVPVSNPWILRPYRTFLEVTQPSSPFILRMRQGKAGEPPSCALFECDGGKWRLEAIQKIAAYLREKLDPGMTVIA